MSRYMNDYDISYAIQRFDAAETTNRLAVARMIDRLRAWTNANSDGWAYWARPRSAANTAMGLVYSTTNQANDLQEENDATAAVVKRAMSPVKAFCTRAIAAEIMTPADRDWILGSLA